jgi:hypothetical protein
VRQKGGQLYAQAINYSQDVLPRVDMGRVAISAIIIVLLGVWVSPFLAGAGSPTNASARDIALPLAAATQAAIQAAASDLAGPAGTNASAALATAPTTQPIDETSAHASILAPCTVASEVSADRPVRPPLAARFTNIHGMPGFWRTGQTPDHVWWFISPQNQAEFLNTVTTVQPFQISRDPDGPRYVAADWKAPLVQDERTMPQLQSWADRTLNRLKQIGFKGIGAWSNPIFHQRDIPMSQDLNVSAWEKGDGRLYSPDWAATADQAIRIQTSPLACNRNLVGYFIDNELDWGDSGSGPVLYFDNLPPTNPNRQQVVAVMKTVWTTLDGFNHDWQTHIKDWKDIDAWTTLPPDEPAAYQRLFSAWLSHLSADYFRITTSLIHKYDPNHLILGVRFRGYAPLEVVRSSRGYTDVVSLNYYVGDARLDMDMFRMMSEESAQPVMISEYSFHALDGRSGNRNTVGFAAQVLDQQARADGYRLLTTRLARVPYVIGADWFQWSDEPPGGRFGDGEDVNFGVVDVDDHAYELLASAIGQTTPTLNPLHAGSASDDQKDVWRESFANKPVMNVPYLTTPITLKGELSDWPSDAKLPAMRHSQTIGLERSKLPVPNVYLGWTDAGLYMGFEVFDNDIQGAPPKGWWWTRDYVEFWISTRPVASDQNVYDVYDHQFFFVPNDFPGEDGLAGVVGQYHRAGDALKADLIPDADIHEAVRILPDRYVVEMFIPGKALHGWDPRHQPAMAFNMHARNWQHALDYFWSAPKEVMTQLRPNTWGMLYLTPPPKELSAQASAN